MEALMDVFGFAPEKEQVVITDWFCHYVEKELQSMSFEIKDNNKRYEIYGACLCLYENGTNIGFVLEHHVNDLLKKEVS